MQSNTYKSNTCAQMQDAEGNVIPGQTNAFKITCVQNAAKDGTDISTQVFATTDCSDEAAAATLTPADKCSTIGTTSIMIDCSAGSMVAPTMLAAVAAVAALFL